jgi:hypothetical protein
MLLSTEKKGRKELKREDAGLGLMYELKTEDRQSFINFLRMSPEMFREMEHKLSDSLTKNYTWYRTALKPGLKLAITLRYMASGENYRSLMYSFRVPHNTICLLIPDVCQAIIDAYSDEVISCPNQSKRILLDRDHDLDDIPEQEIQKELKSQGVVNVKRFNKKM